MIKSAKIYQDAPRGNIHTMIQTLIRTLTLCIALFAANAAAQDTPDYPLGPGDTLRIQVFQNPDLTVETRVSESGSITYPLIGVVELGGLSIAAAEKKIAAAQRPVPKACPGRGGDV